MNLSTTTTIVWITDTRLIAGWVEGCGAQSQVRQMQCLEFQAPDSLCGEFDAEKLAGAVAELLGNVHGPIQSLRLVIPLNWCFHHVLEAPTSKKAERNVAFEVEPYLPVTLESLTLAHHAISRSIVVCGIATAPMKCLLQELARRNCPVDVILVDAIAGAGSHELRSCLVRDHRWAGWASFGDRQLSIRTRSGAGFGEPAEDGWSVDLVSMNGAEMAAAEPVVRSFLAAASDPRPILNLAVGELSPAGGFDTAYRLAGHCLALLLVLGAVFMGGVAYHRSVLATHQAAIDQARRDNYCMVFGGDTSPVGAATRLASERIRLEALTRTGSGEGGPQLATTPLLDRLRGVIAVLPADVRIKLVDLRLDETQLTLRGQTTEHRDAERIVEAINRMSDLEARPPRSTRLSEGGVEFSVVALEKGPSEPEP